MSGADTGISKSEVSRICAGLDTEVAEFRDRTLAAQDFPHVFLDATYCKARVGHRIVSQAIVVAIGVAADGRREVLGFDVGDSENEGFWTSFLRSLKTRGLEGVQPVMSDAHNGLKKAIGTVFQGAGWQRCRVHFMRNVLVVGVFPNSAALLRLAGSVLIEQHDKWEAGERRYFSEASMLELATMNNPVEVIDEAVTSPNSPPPKLNQLTRTVSKNSTTQRDVTSSNYLEPAKPLLWNYWKGSSWHRRPIPRQQPPPVPPAREQSRDQLTPALPSGLPRTPALPAGV